MARHRGRVAARRQDSSGCAAVITALLLVGAVLLVLGIAYVKLA